MNEKFYETVADVSLAVVGLIFVRALLNTRRVNPEFAFAQELRGSFNGWAW